MRRLTGLLAGIAFAGLLGCEQGAQPVEKRPAAPLEGGAARTTQGPQVGDAAPDFTLPSSASQTPFRLSERRGKKVVILFYLFDFTGG